MDTYFLLSAVFFVMLILFQGLQSVGKKMNKIANTYGVRKEKPQPYVKSEPKVEIAKEESKKPEDDNSFAQRCKRQIEYEKTLAPGSEELRKAREDFKKAYLEERESVRVKMCEGREIRIKAIEKSPEYYAGIEQYNHDFDLFFSMEEDYVNYIKESA